MSTPVSALLTGQPALASCAAFSKPAASMPSTRPRTVSLMPVIMNPPRSLSGPKPTSAVTSRLCGVPPALAMTPENAMSKQEACAAAISSSGLVLPSAASEVRFGQETSKVPRPELASSVRPEPSCSVPVQAVRAVRVAIGAPSGVAALGWTTRRPALTRRSTGVPRSADGFSAVDPLGEQPQPLPELVELAGVEPDRADHLLGDGEGLVAKGAAVLGQRDGDRALVLDPAVPCHQAGGGEPLQQGRQGAAVQRQARTELADGLVVGLPEQHHDEVLRIGQAEGVEHRPVARRHGPGSGVQREAQLVVERHTRCRQSGHGQSLGRGSANAMVAARSAGPWAVRRAAAA